MTVTTRTNNGLTVESITYGFDPQHTSEAIGFYTKMFWEGKILGFTAVLDSGEKIAIGEN